ncbi:alpha-L-rhamnosidase C-terminal domain-containing protein [Asticcacaulis sp. DXS10W]|uniref:Alpha-L-rhamnosidase C-terminal domain-containing protein n=1 Tax=Asticcacaulis currens TaxID=2984210 RepID=A0ABT5IBF3_9CAUL|nr:alpha-L-rhamnosidase C-terminal domain-containing protein [Asticcacaulis currens]MDC7693511.1 alpha-L-rhamnosidase C-terminal domain-containing protein [Asticcacaulis currens]
MSARPHALSLLAFCLGLTLSAPVHAKDAQWIAHPDLPAGGGVQNFQKSLSVTKRPKALWVRVSADNRFVLYVNGQRVVSGPATSDLANWRYERVDIAPYLKRGENSIAAVVWNASAAVRPLAQISARGGFYLDAESTEFEALDSGTNWRVSLDKGRSFGSGYAQIIKQFKTLYYVGGSPETIDAAKSNWGWEQGAGTGIQWTDAQTIVKPGEVPSWTLTPNPLPKQIYRKVSSGRVVRTDIPGTDSFPDKAVTIPAYTKGKILLRRDVMVSGYPSLEVAKGADATIRATYSEALYDEKNMKGDRDEVGTRLAKGLQDSFRLDGAERTLAPLFWRTWRYLELDIETKDQPLVLKGFSTYETGYPFQQIGSFLSDDVQLNKIWEVGWRTALIDAHETYMDTAYWEQLQYIGDTRLQALISYAVSGDTRLAVNAIDAMGRSRTKEGVLEGAYPVHRGNTISTFSLLWIAMLSDYQERNADNGVVARNLPRARELMSWFDPFVSDSGLLRKNPGWNFVDWVGQTGADRNAFPTYDENGDSCLMALHYLGALQQMSALETSVGETARAAAFDTRAAQIAEGVRSKCWNAERGLFADTPALKAYSQHTNALAILYGVVPKETAKAILKRITSGDGIDAPDGITPVSYYFAWYLVEAFEKAGEGEAYHALLKTWRDLLKLNYTTWPEERGNTRSDTHAWSAHPTADMLEIIAGIKPAASHYAAVRIEPHLGSLKKLDATAQTPAGPVSVRYRRTGTQLRATIDIPKNLSGVFVWNDREQALKPGRNTLTFP